MGKNRSEAPGDALTLFTTAAPALFRAEHPAHSSPGFSNHPLRERFGLEAAFPIAVHIFTSRVMYGLETVFPGYLA